MQRRLDRLAERFVNAIGDQRIEPRALVNFVEVGNRLAREELARTVAASHRGAFGVVKRSLDEVAGGHQVLESLLVLNSDSVAAEVIGQSHGGQVHLALLTNLVVSEIVLVPAA